MSSSVPSWLLAKSLIVGTPLDSAAKRLRWLLGAKDRYSHPELWEMYLEERQLPAVLQRILKEDSCGVDVGAHIGSFLSLLARYAPRGRHVAFEASATKSRWLKRRFPMVEIFPYAVTDEAGSAIFQEDLARPGYSRLQSSILEPETCAVSYEVQACCLDDVLLEKNRVDLIKLDIEGSELAALRGGARLIKRWHPVIIFECGSEYYLNQQKISRQELYNFITAELDYSIYCFTDFLFSKGAMAFEEFRKCGLYPFRAFNFVALPAEARPSP